MTQHGQHSWMQSTMPKVTKPSLTLIEGQGIKKKLCEFCAGPEHAAQLACPRIASVTYYADGEAMDVYFHRSADLVLFWGEDDEKEEGDEEKDDGGPPAA